MDHNLSELIVMPSGQERGGAEEALLQYVSYRVGQGVRPRIVLLERGTLTHALTARGAIASELPAGRLRNAWRWMLTVSRIVRIARREQPDLILSWMVKGHAYGGVAGFIIMTNSGRHDPRKFADDPVVLAGRGDHLQLEARG